MSMSINKATLLGNVGRDPEIRNLPNGGRVASYPLATSERWRDKSGEQRERTEWHRIVIFNTLFVEITEDRIRKSSRVYLEGKIQTRKWQDQSGQERHTTEVVLNRFDSKMIVLDSRGHYDDQDDQNDDEGGSGYTQRPGRRASSYQHEDAGDDGGPDGDGEIPF